MKTIFVSLLFSASTFLFSDCPDDATEVNWSRGGSSCVQFPSNWTSIQNINWIKAADEIRCAPDNTVIMARPLN